MNLKRKKEKLSLFSDITWYNVVVKTTGLGASVPGLSTQFYNFLMCDF